MTASSAERRYKRVRYRVPVGCLGQFEVFEARTENLSEDGVCLRAERPFPDGLLLSLIFRLPTRSRPLVVCARVCWSRQDPVSGRTNCGIQYLWLSPDDRQALAGFLGFFKDENENEAGWVSAMVGQRMGDN